MTPKTELLLYQLLWTAGIFLRPTYRNLNQGFEGWCYRNGYLRQVRRLEEAGYLESRQSEFDGKRVHRLTEAGRIAALGGRDPEAAWDTVWDRKWRLFLFDVPESQRSLRKNLTRALAAAGCGCLQGSVWIFPTLPAAMAGIFAPDAKDCSHLILLEADSRGERMDAKMVAASWDFKKIQELYSQHSEVLACLPSPPFADLRDALANWAKKEKEAWLSALRADPLLPAPLLPPGYNGRKAWEKRKTVLNQAALLVAKLTAGTSPGSTFDLDK